MLTLKRLSSQREQLLFKNLNLEIGQSQYWWIKGPNGIGKSSLLQLLVGLAVPSRGSIHWHELEFSYLGHQDALDLQLTPFENLRYQQVLSQSDNSKAALLSIWQNLGLAHLQHQLCKHLSLGQRRKVALSRLIWQARPVWIVDEPFTGLDEVSIKQIETYFVQHLQQGSVIITSHSQPKHATHTLNLADYQC